MLIPVVGIIPARIPLRNAEEEQRPIGIARIRQLDQRLVVLVLLRFVRSPPLLAPVDHPQHFPLGGAVARNGILVGSKLEGLLDRDLARFSVLHKAKGSIHYDVEGRRGREPRSRTSLAISPLALAELARSWGPPRADTRSHAAFLRSANRGVPPVSVL